MLNKNSSRRFGLLGRARTEWHFACFAFIGRIPYRESFNFSKDAIKRFTSTIFYPWPNYDTASTAAAPIADPKPIRWTTDIRDISLLLQQKCYESHECSSDISLPLCLTIYSILVAIRSHFLPRWQQCHLSFVACPHTDSTLLSLAARKQFWPRKISVDPFISIYLYAVHTHTRARARHKYTIFKGETWHKYVIRRDRDGRPSEARAAGAFHLSVACFVKFSRENEWLWKWMDRIGRDKR